MQMRDSRAADYLLRGFLAVILAVGTCAGALAQNSDSPDESEKTIVLSDTIVVSAFRYETDMFNRPESMSVLNRKEINRLQPMTTPDMMSIIPGVWMQKTNLGGGSPYIRGLTGYQTLILVDGIRLNNSTFRSGPNQYLNTVDPFSVHRAEVLRGSGSVQYGSDAMGGTLHLRTKELEFAPARFRVGGSGFAKYWSGNMEKTGRMGLHATGENIAFGGGFTLKSLGDISRGDGGKQKPTGYNERAADLKLKVKLHPRHTVTASYQHLRQDDVPLYHQIENENYSEFVFDPQQRDLGYLRWNGSFASKIVRKATLTLSGQRSIEGRRSRRWESTTTKMEKDVVHTIGAGFDALSEIQPNWTASSGIEFYYDKIGSEALLEQETHGSATPVRGLYPDGSDYQSLAAYTMHDITANKWTFTFGGRFNTFRLSVKDTVFGNTVITPTALVGNVGVVWAVHPKHHLVASANTGFRAPNLNDVSSFGIADFRFEVPSYDLKPERSLNKEVGYKFRSEKAWMGISFYHNDLYDLITNQPSAFNGMDSLQGFKVYQRKNSERARIVGFEIEGEMLLTQGVSIKANTSYCHGQNISDEEPMRRIPPLHGRIAAHFDLIQHVWIMSEWQFAGSQTRLSGGDISDFRIETGGTPGWNLFNLHAGYERTWFTVSAGIHNLLDELYRTHGSGIDGIGRSVWISLDLRL
jgi:outer membrane receptor protein involved in Fe transport